MVAKIAEAVAIGLTEQTKRAFLPGSALTRICHYYSLPGNAVDTSGVLIFCLVPPQKVAEITPFGTTVCNL